MPEKKVTKPGSEPITTKFSWDTFVKDCANSKYVLVIGSEAVLSKNANLDANGDSTSLLFNLTKDHLKGKGFSIGNEIRNFTQISHGIDAKLHKNVLETIEDLDFTSSFDNEVEPTLVELLKTNCFRIVLTTTIDPYLQIAMEKAWGENVNIRILNLYGDDKDILPNEQSFDEFDEIQPTLYYVFGKADENNDHAKFVLTENDAMSTISRWFASERPAELLKYIQGEGMKILSIGCRFDDWLFRFFWYVLRGDVSNLSSGQVAIELDNEKDKNLINFLKHENIKHFPDARAFMAEATRRITKEMKCEFLPRKSDGIFISYASEDKYLARHLFWKLHKSGWNVWLDEEKLQGSDDYHKRIENAIKGCRIFIPILSSQTKRDLEKESLKDYSASGRFYMNFEWAHAQVRYEIEKDLADQTKRMSIYPIVVGRHYDVRSSYHKKAPKCITDATVFELPQKTENLIELIKKNI